LACYGCDPYPRSDRYASLGAPLGLKSPGLTPDTSLTLLSGSSKESETGSMLVAGTQVPSIAISPLEQIRFEVSAIAVGAARNAKAADVIPAAASSPADRALARPFILQPLVDWF
jgi:hypothetical protein